MPGRGLGSGQVADSPRSASGATRPIVPVVLAGGLGSRLWPVSRAARPKPFHRLGGARSLLQLALLRAATVTGCAPVIVANETHRFLVAEQCRAIGLDGVRIALEPAGRGTAAAIVLGANLARLLHVDPLVLVLPADHLIDGAGAFARDVGAAATHAAANPGALVAFGVAPRSAETAYGYIEQERGGGSRGPAAERAGNRAGGVWPVRRFVEKPEAAAAEAFVASGRFLWNSGMLLFDARACRDAVDAHCPALGRNVEGAAAAGCWDGSFFRPGAAYARAPAGSFDVLVMERTDRAFVVSATFGWTDVGSWWAVREAGPKDARGNRVVGDAVLTDVEDSLIVAGSRLVAAIGVRDLAVVETADAVLVAHRDRLQDVRALVERLRASGRAESEVHRAVDRPWGRFETVLEGEGYRVKRLTVDARAALSLQRHAHRSEHWVVVGGIAEVTRGEETFELRENESAVVPLGTVHRLRNLGDEPLEVVEIQVGDYLGEDDIERLEDDYGRVAQEPARTGRPRGARDR